MIFLLNKTFKPSTPSPSPNDFLASVESNNNVCAQGVV